MKYQVKIEETGGKWDKISVLGDDGYQATAEFSTNSLGDGVLRKVTGDENLIREILMEWGGENEFTYIGV